MYILKCNYIPYRGFVIILQNFTVCIQIVFYLEFNGSVVDVSLQGEKMMRKMKCEFKNHFQNFDKW